jgi:FAD/FMN-containing dehydrogenase/Fe-S oxidoreductase
MKNILRQIQKELEGELYFDDLHTIMYATDASAYRIVPLAVCYPANEQDIRLLIDFANQYKIPLTPRAAGTSLGGQALGEGIIVDISKHFTKILDFDPKKQTIRVQAGVIRDEINRFAAPYNLFFSPETSTSNRCMIGGMIGNNSCGLHSLEYGSTRDHLLSVKGFLPDGTKVLFKELSPEEWMQKSKQNNTEGNIYRQLHTLLSSPATQQSIRNQYPDSQIKRRNSGYALDSLLNTQIFQDTNTPLNLSHLIAGSEGTLLFITEACLHLSPLPPKHKALLLTHHESLQNAYQANIQLLTYAPSAIELMDDNIIRLASQNKNIFAKMGFIKGKPKAVLMTEINSETKREIQQKIKQIQTQFDTRNLAYDYSILWDDEISNAWEIRKAGLGVLSNMPGDKKPVPLIEDMAVKPQDLPAFMEEIDRLLNQHQLSCVYYGHIATGELHLRPVLNLKTPKDRKLFHTIGLEAAKIVKKYKGSLSGEHGDGRLRSEFLPLVYDADIILSFEAIKKNWDPQGIFNPGIITNPPANNLSLRYRENQKTIEPKTYFDFTQDAGYIHSIEKCNGSGDCRKPAKLGNLMCPSYQASLDEKNTTRARANILREYLNKTPQSIDFRQAEIHEVLDLCLSCKGCKSECPSAVDMTKLKAETLQQTYDQTGSIPWRTRLIANIHHINHLFRWIPSVYNSLTAMKWTSAIIKKILHFAPQRTLPSLSTLHFNREIRKLKSNKLKFHSNVYFFADEFTQSYDVEIGIKAVDLLQHLGYKVIIPKYNISGRTLLSKGMLRKAKKIATQNINYFYPLIHPDTPLIGIEPSAILTFKDEYIDLSVGMQKQKAKSIQQNVFYIDDFLAKEMKSGNISQTRFTKAKKHIKLHTHCHQKALSPTGATRYVLSFPENYTVEEIASGCCGMAGSFGMEKTHYDLSMKIGELILFPAIRETSDLTLIAAPGTSCRHQIQDGTQRTGLHPVEILWDALIP